MDVVHQALRQHDWLGAALRIRQAHSAKEGSLFEPYAWFSSPKCHRDADQDGAKHNYPDPHHKGATPGNAAKRAAR